MKTLKEFISINENTILINRNKSLMFAEIITEILCISDDFNPYQLEDVATGEQEFQKKITQKLETILELISC